MGHGGRGSSGGGGDERDADRFATVAMAAPRRRRGVVFGDVLGFAGSASAPGGGESRAGQWEPPRAHAVGEQAVVADLGKRRGQDVQKETAHEGLQGKDQGDADLASQPFTSESQKHPGARIKKQGIDLAGRGDTQG